MEARAENPDIFTPPLNIDLARLGNIVDIKIRQAMGMLELNQIEEREILEFEIQNNDKFNGADFEQSPFMRASIGSLDELGDIMDMTVVLSRTVNSKGSEIIMWDLYTLKIDRAAYFVNDIRMASVDMTKYIGSIGAAEAYNEFQEQLEDEFDNGLCSKGEVERLITILQSSWPVARESE